MSEWLIILRRIKRDIIINVHRFVFLSLFLLIVKVKVIPQRGEVAQAVPGRLKSRIFLTFGTTRVVGRQP
jgi:hypothetical protein